jgi:RHS repeat-associated protein
MMRTDFIYDCTPHFVHSRALIASRYTGKERDTESGLDYMTARFYASTMGRFTSPDPLMFNELRLVNPQRWNMYSYAVNNPLSFTDPDGRDAIAVNFGADVHGLGHMGIISVHANGNATYSRFGPQHPGSPADVGAVQTTTDLPNVQFDSKGNPTEASYEALTAAVAKFEDNYTGSVKMFHFKTSEAETAALDDYIKRA